MTRFLPLDPGEHAEIIKQVEAHLAQGGELIELPRYVLTGLGGACPQRHLHSLRAWAMPEVATAAVALAERVDTATVMDRLNGVRSRLAITLATQMGLAEARALEHAERKARAKLSGQTAERFKGFPDVRAVSTVGGVAALLHGAWDTVDESMKGAIADAAREKQQILGQAVSEAEATAQAEQYRRRGLLAVSFLLSLLAARSEGRISGERRIPPLGPAIRRASQYIEGATPALDAEATKGPPRLPPDILAVLAAAPDQRIIWTWIHSFYGVPQQPFDPHVEIDAETFTSGELESIQWFPGDHVGCLCETIPGMGVF